MKRYFIYLTSLILCVCCILSGCDSDTGATERPTQAASERPSAQPWPTQVPSLIRPQGNIVWESDCTCGCGTIEENRDIIYENIEKSYPNFIYVTVLGKEYGMSIKDTTKETVDVINRDHLIVFYTFEQPEEYKDVVDDLRPYEKYAYFDKNGVLQRLTFKTRYNECVESDEKAFEFAETIAKERADISGFEKDIEAKEKYWKVSYKSGDGKTIYHVTIDATKDISMPSFTWWMEKEPYNKVQYSFGDAEKNLAEDKLTEIVDATVQHVSKNQRVEEQLGNVDYDFFFTAEYELVIKYTIDLTVQNNGLTTHKINAYYYTEQYIN